MRTVFITRRMIFDTSTTKVNKYIFSLFDFNNSEKCFKTKKVDKIEFWKWFNSAEEAEQYLKTL